MKTRIATVLLGGVLISAAIGCNPFSGGASKSVQREVLKADSDPMAPEEAAEFDSNAPVVIKINGKPAATKEEFLEFTEQALKANPYLANFGITSYESAPAPIREQLFEAMVQQKLITQWGRDEGVANETEYQTTLKKTIEQLKQALMAQTFEKQILADVVVNANEVAQEYETNKERFIKEHGSATVVAAQLDDADAAKVLYEMVAEEQSRSLNDAAEELGAEVKEFGKVSRDPRLAMGSDIPFPVRRAVFELADDQYFGQAQDGDTHWVIQVVDRNKATYMTLEEVQPQVEDLVRNNKFRVARDERLKELRGKYTVDVDKSSLGGSGEDPLAALQAALAQHEGDGEEADDVDPEMLEQDLASDVEDDMGDDL